MSPKHFFHNIPRGHSGQPHSTGWGVLGFGREHNKSLVVLTTLFFGLLCFGLQAKPAKAAIVQIEVATTTGNATTSNATITFATSTTAGELIVVNVIPANMSGSAATSTVTDNKGDVYTALWAVHLNYNFNDDLFYLANAPAGVTTINVTFPAGIVFGGVSAAHYTGVATTNPLDTYIPPNTTGSSTPWASGAVTTNQANELLIGTEVAAIDTYNGDNRIGIAPSGNWIQDAAFGNSGGFDGNNGNFMSYTHQIVSSVQTNIQNTGTNNGSANVFANYSGIATFEAAAGTPATPPPTEYWLNGIIHLIGNFIFR